MTHPTLPPDDLIKLLARASGVELHAEEDGSRYVVLIKFGDKGDACTLWDVVSDLEPAEDCSHLSGEEMGRRFVKAWQKAEPDNGHE